MRGGTIDGKKWVGTSLEAVLRLFFCSEVFDGDLRVVGVGRVVRYKPTGGNDSDVGARLRLNELLLRLGEDKAGSPANGLSSRLMGV